MGHTGQQILKKEPIPNPGSLWSLAGALLIFLCYLPFYLYICVFLSFKKFLQ